MYIPLYVISEFLYTEEDAACKQPWSGSCAGGEEIRAEFCTEATDEAESRESVSDAATDPAASMQQREDCCRLWARTETTSWREYVDIVCVQNAKNSDSVLCVHAC